MRFGVLGSGQVGQGIASKLVELGHEVTMGSRQAGNERAVAWVRSVGERANEGAFADAAAFGEILINATNGLGSLDALQAAGEANLAGKILIDLANPLDFSSGFPPTLSVCNTDSLGEQIQRTFPQARVVKSLNTINADVMTNPAIVPGSHTIFVSGNDAEAKAQVKELLVSFGWSAEDVFDLGDISTARGAEIYVVLWLRMRLALEQSHFNIKVVVSS